MEAVSRAVSGVRALSQQAAAMVYTEAHEASSKIA